MPDGDRPPAISRRWDFIKRDVQQATFRRAARERVLEAIRRRGLQVSGVIPPGRRVEIDPLLLPHLILDLEHDTARTADGLICWQALAVAPRPAPSEPVQATSPARFPGRQRDFLKWYRTAYPDGHPAGKKLETLAHEAAGALACRISTRTIRRALAGRALTERGQRTKAAR
jgi:hypothetical protein